MVLLHEISYKPFASFSNIVRKLVPLALPCAFDHLAMLQWLMMKVQARKKWWTLPRFTAVRNPRFASNRGWGEISVTRSLENQKGFGGREIGIAESMRGRTLNVLSHGLFALHKNFDTAVHLTK